MINFKAYPVYKYLAYFILGIVGADYFSIGLFGVGCLACVLFILSFAAIKFPKFLLLRQAFPLFFLLLGFGIKSQNKIENQPFHIFNKTNYEAYLVKINTKTEDKAKTFKVEGKVYAVKSQGQWEKALGKTLLYFNKEAGVYPQYGQLFLIKGEPRIIEPPKNPLEFDYKKYQQRKNIYTHHFLRANDFVFTGKSDPNPIFEWAYRLNELTHQVFTGILQDGKQLGVAEALVAGMKSELDQDVRQQYSNAGAIHVLAVSGMHVGILFLILKWVFMLFLNPKKAPFTILVILALWFYALFTGLSPSVCRATLMFSLIQLGALFYRDNNSLNVMAFSALLLLVINPDWLYDVGFQLSYLAVFGILVLYKPIKNLLEIHWLPLRWLWEISVVSFSAQLFTFPLSIYYFHQFPNYFLITNPPVALLATFILPVGFLVLFTQKLPVVFDFIATFFKILLNTLNFIIEKIQDLPFSVTKALVIHEFSLLLLYLVIISTLLFLFYKNLRFLQIATLFILILCIQRLYTLNIQNKQNEITFHYIPNGSGISFVSARSATFISHAELLTDPLIHQYHLKNYYDQSGISDFKKLDINEGKNLFIKKNEFRLQWLQTSQSNLKIDKEVNFLLISKNAVKDLNQIVDFKGKVILDGSNQKWVVEKLLAQSQTLGIEIISLYNKGSKTYKS
jgi:competence protein ComEC